MKAILFAAHFRRGTSLQNPASQGALQAKQLAREVRNLFADELIVVITTQGWMRKSTTIFIEQANTLFASLPAFIKKENKYDSLVSLLNTPEVPGEVFVVFADPPSTKTFANKFIKERYPKAQREDLLGISLRIGEAIVFEPDDRQGGKISFILQIGD